MIRTLNVLVAAVAFLLCLPPESPAREGGRPDTLLKVSVRVSGDPEIANLVKSFIGRELRSINDVQVTNTGPDWVFHVITVAVKLKKGVITGYGVSVIILETFNSEALTPLLDKRYADRAHTLTADLYSVKKHLINIGSRDDIKNICRQIVADVDKEFLAIKRKRK
jgi:hypothetical protein